MRLGKLNRPGVEQHETSRSNLEVTNMSCRWILLSLPILAFVTIVLWPIAGSTQRVISVRPAALERMQNLELSASSSHRPAYIPPEWGKLVSVQRLNDTKLQLFLQAESGDIYFVRLTQQGEYLYLDTSDQGGVALVLRRSP
jgi:hypothetical protein